MRKKTDREYRRDRSTAARPPRRRPAATRRSGTKTMTFLSNIEAATRTLALIEKMPHAVGMRLSSKEDRPVRSWPATCSPRSASHRSKRMAISLGRRSQWKPPTRLRRFRRKARRRRDVLKIGDGEACHFGYHPPLNVRYTNHTGLSCDPLSRISWRAGGSYRSIATFPPRRSGSRFRQRIWSQSRPTRWTISPRTFSPRSAPPRLKFRKRPAASSNAIVPKIIPRPCYPA